MYICNILIQDVDDSIQCVDAIIIIVDAIIIIVDALTEVFDSFISRALTHQYWASTF